MGIYPNVDYTDLRADDQIVGLVRTTSTPGLVITETFTLSNRSEERTDCYCCSCGERDGDDPACRNHGWAAERPCELHGMPGIPWTEEAGESAGRMPMSVQAEYARRSDLSS